MYDMIDHRMFTLQIFALISRIRCFERNMNETLMKNMRLTEQIKKLSNERDDLQKRIQEMETNTKPTQQGYNKTIQDMSSNEKSLHSRLQRAESEVAGLKGERQELITERDAR